MSSLELAPFRAVRYAASRVRSLDRVTAPPYDMLDADTTDALRASDPYNVVHLTLPSDTVTARSAGRMFRTWRSNGVLVTDEQPGLYVYEQRDARGFVRQRGLLGALGLRQPDQRIVLPHEDVMPGPVAGRLALLRACQANLEPLLMAYDGAGPAVQQIITTTVATPPMLHVELTAESADADHGRQAAVGQVEHRVWPITDRERLAAIDEALREQQALIGDGHHRYAAAVQLQSEQHAAGAGNGPWDYVLTLLVDQQVHPLEVTAIHRVVDDLELETAMAQMAPQLVTAASGQAFESARQAFDSASGVRVLATDGMRWHLLRPAAGSSTVRHTDAGSERGPGPDTEPDTALVDDVVLRELLRVPEERVRYVHGWDDAVQTAHRHRGVALLLSAVDPAVVLARARRGIRMPRKSTSFGPKPRTGLVVRAFDA